MTTPVLSNGEVWAVSWGDAHLNALDEAETGDIVHRPWVYVSVGILVKSDTHGVTLSMDKGEDGKYRTRNFIPRAMVINEWKVGTLKMPRPRRRPTPPPAPPA